MKKLNKYNLSKSENKKKIAERAIIEIGITFQPEINQKVNEKLLEQRRNKAKAGH